MVDSIQRQASTVPPIEISSDYCETMHQPNDSSHEGRSAPRTGVRAAGLNSHRNGRTLRLRKVSLRNRPMSVPNWQNRSGSALGSATSSTAPGPTGRTELFHKFISKSGRPLFQRRLTLTKPPKSSFEFSRHRLAAEVASEPSRSDPPESRPRTTQRGFAPEAALLQIFSTQNAFSDHGLPVTRPMRGNSQNTLKS